MSKWNKNSENKKKKKEEISDLFIKTRVAKKRANEDA